mmetsp:Transcript_20403/g.36542  ORF Transcript_20403/g.36542 Transcript_20403/m.36542 type:complete len:96 (+) Transcript_20403:233-520(+)
MVAAWKVWVPGDVPDILEAVRTGMAELPETIGRLSAGPSSSSLKDWLKACFKCGKSSALFWFLTDLLNLLRTYRPASLNAMLKPRATEMPTEFNP